MSIENYPCNLSPNGFCPDCTNDGPLCDFDECPLVLVNHYVKVPDGMDFNTEFPTYILAYCPDTVSWFATNKRFFYYEYPTEFKTEDEAIKFFRSHAAEFYRIGKEITEYLPSFAVGVVFLDNTGESICVCEERNDEAMKRARDDDYAEF